AARPGTIRLADRGKRGDRGRPDGSTEDFAVGRAAREGAQVRAVIVEGGRAGAGKGGAGPGVAARRREVVGAGARAGEAQGHGARARESGAGSRTTMAP